MPVNDAKALRNAVAGYLSGSSIHLETPPQGEQEQG
jgi:ribosomal protein S17E